MHISFLSYSAALMLLLLFFLESTFAQSNPTGLWTTFSDDASKAQAIVRITEREGKLSGRIEQLLDTQADKEERCIHCKGNKRGQKLVGLEIIENINPVSENGTWGHGTILDPENGEEYRLELKPKEKGRQLVVRGYWGPFWRTQIWYRAE